MHGSAENHLTRIGIEGNIMFQLLQKKNNLNKRNQGLKLETKDQDQRKEYYLASILTSSISNLSDSWWINSGATKHMTRYKKALAVYEAKKFHKKVKLGDGSTYAIN